jgi:hypothetical protein
MFRIFKKEKERKKEKETKNHEKNSKMKKPEKKLRKKKNPGCRCVNGPAQYRAHAGRAGLGPINERSIGFAK